MIFFIIYKTINNSEPFIEWFYNLDKSIQNRINTRLVRLENGNYGDFTILKEADEIKELRFTIGSGYRVYIAEIKNDEVLILTGGSKATQKMI